MYFASHSFVHNMMFLYEKTNNNKCYKNKYLCISINGTHLSTIKRALHNNYGNSFSLIYWNENFSYTMYKPCKGLNKENRKSAHPLHTLSVLSSRPPCITKNYQYLINMDQLYKWAVFMSYSLWTFGMIVLFI